MTVLTSRLNLVKWVTGDRFKKAELAGNWDKIDAAPGTQIVGSRSEITTWTSAQNGRRIIETSTGLEWYWDGTAFKRTAPVGHLGTHKVTGPGPSTTSTDLSFIAATVDVVVPAGGRSVEVIVSGSGVHSTVDLSRLAIWRGSTQIQSWLSHGVLSGSASSQPRPVSMVLRDDPPAGSVTYTLRLAAEPGYGGTSTLMATADTPLSLSIVEV